MSYEVTYVDIDEYCEREIEARGSKVWRSFASIYACAEMPMTDENVGEIKQAVRDYMPQILQELEAELTTRKLVNGKGAGDVVERALKKMDAEIEETCVVF
jgi:hypothetical protein